MKKVFLFTLSFFLLSFLFVSPVLADLSFEQGLTDWTVEKRNDSWPGTLHEYISSVITDRYSEGVQSVRLGAKVVGDYSPLYIVVANGDNTQTIVWKNGTYDLTHGLSVSVDMTDIQHAMQQYSWGWGMEADLILSDGTNETRSLLWDYHEETVAPGYGPPGLEDNLYTSIIVGADGNQWFRYRVPLTAEKWYGTDFGGGPLSGLDLSHVKIGVVYAATNWNSSPQTLWANGLVDNVRIEYKDTDEDGVTDISDNCPVVANPDQADLDGDGLGDVCDNDKDGDGVADISDNCPVVANPDQADLDGDGLGDVCDNDKDGDGVANISDNCPVVANPDQADLDNDGKGDACDDDKDGDGVTNDIDCDDLNGEATMVIGSKACILYTSGVQGKGVLSSPGLREPFNENSNAAENAGKKK